MRALSLVNQLWFIAPVSSWKFRVSYELLSKINRPQVCMVYRHDKPRETLEEHSKKSVNHSPAARDLRILLVFFQHLAWFISLQTIKTCGLLLKSITIIS